MDVGIGIIPSIHGPRNIHYRWVRSPAIVPISDQVRFIRLAPAGRELEPFDQKPSLSSLRAVSRNTSG